ncbi:hypothetical protein [Enterococcus faecium]|uniref:hypothetical protein n=1 Tax=Enterococcus faecium TaxID=1352 RepID=UPI000B624A57|nr:hypothetical protein [Enterococcus faecium]OTO54121.1 hypothetical protein A5814_002243 [Enterococcus faecium]
MSEDQLIGTIYSQLIEEFVYTEKDLWMIAENIAGKIASQPAQLNYNQKMVLEWLKEKTCKCNKPIYPMNLVRKAVEKMPVEIVNYYDRLSDKEEYEVLAAFAQWGLEQEEAE